MKKFLDLSIKDIQLYISQCIGKAVQELTEGLGWKEASHFLRNVGYKDVAIIDRHIINCLCDSGSLKDKPNSISRTNTLKLKKL